MARYTITPWRTHADLLQVRQELYRLNQDGTDQRRHAADRVMAWKLRGNLPHAVETTALLVDAILHHHASQLNSAFSIQAVYSAAFTRFVTGFCDIGRARERMLEPSSMLEIAKQIDMPTEFVALRHEATHEDLPGIQRLVKATKQALDWLWKMYWSRLEEPENGELIAADVAAMKDQAKTVLRAFRSEMREAVLTSKPSSAQPMELVKRTNQTCNELCQSKKRNFESLTGVLVDDRLILPSARELGSSMEGAFLIWEDLLQELSKGHISFLPSLIHRLLENLTSESDQDLRYDPGKEALSLWLAHLVSHKALIQVSDDTKKALRGEMMKWCCLHPGPWTEKLGRQLLDSEDAVFDEEWRKLFEASLLADVPESAGKSEIDGLECQEGSPEGFLPTNDEDRAGRMDDRFEIEVRAGSWTRLPTAPKGPVGVVS